MIISAPFITMITADSANRGNTVDVCTFLWQQPAAGESGIVLGAERWSSCSLIQPKQDVAIALASSRSALNGWSAMAAQGRSADAGRTNSSHG